MSLPAERSPEQTLHLRPHPFASEQALVQVRAGQSLQAMLQEAAGGAELNPNLAVRINGYDVPQAFWPRVRPKAGVLINVTAMPAGSTGKKILRAVLLIVVAVVAAVVSFYFGPLAGALVAMLGNLLVNALLPPPKPPKAPNYELGQWNQLTSSSNQINPYGAIPLVLGESKIYPVHAAMPYSETIGETSYQRLLFDLGYGDVEVSDLKIGETAIAEYDEVEYEVGVSPGLYTSDVYEEAVNAAMNDAGDLTRTTAPDADEISLDVVFPQGLFGFNKDGKQRNATALFNVEYKAVGSGTWLPAPFTATDTRLSGFKHVGGTWPLNVITPHKKPFAVGISWNVTPGQYDVRVRRSTTDWNGATATNRIGDAVWGALRTIRHTAPSTTGTTKLAMRIKSSEQLNGALQNFSCIVRQRIPVWNGTSWASPAVNLNPAWVLHWLLTSCPAISRHVDPARIDLPQFLAYADFCTAHDFETRAVVDSRTTARAVIDDLLANALGGMSLRDGKYSIIFDDGAATPTMAFTPLDSSNFAVSRAYVEIPHALKVRFKNPAADWDMDEIVVLDDGYSYRGVDARGVASTDPEPTLFETLELRFCADAISAWRIGRFHFAQAKYRPNNYAFETDVANMACARGDMILVSHDVTEWGDGWGRVVSLTGTALVLDETVTTETGPAYSARIRKDDGTTVVLGCTPASTYSNEFTLASAPTGVNPGDVVVIGETSLETRKLYVTGIVPKSDLAASITCVEYDDRVYDYWQDPPASIVSEITGNSLTDPPAAPSITIVISDERNDDVSDGGDSDASVHIGVTPGSSDGYLEITPPIARTRQDK